LFYVVGITVWSYFSETLLKISGVLRENAGIFGKVYFPRLIMPLSIVFSSLFKFGVQLLLLVLLMIYFAINGGGFNVPWQVIFFPLLVIMIALQSLGLGMIVAALAVKYRDLAMLLGFGLQLLMYATPIVYPLSSMNGTLKIVIASNPMTAVVESMRFCLLGKGTVELPVLVYSILMTIVLFILGIIIYNKAEKSFVDTV
jgi:lipopolysaccharide transport system permease protein